MIERKTEFHVRVDPTESGVVQIRFEKRVLDDAGNLIERTYHRTCVEPGTALDEQMVPVNAHLVQLGYETPDAVTMERMRKEVEAVHTPERVAKYKADRAAREKEARDRLDGKK